MAYYDSYNPRAKKPRRSEKWEEEGTRYRGAYAQKYRGRDHWEDRSSHSDEEQWNGRRENRKSERPAYAPHTSGDVSRRGGQRAVRRPYDSRPGDARGPRPERRPYEDRRPPRRDEPVMEKSYREFEHVPQTPAREENLPADNLLVGRNPIREAIRSGRDLEKLLVVRGELQGSAREIIQMAREKHIVVQEVDKSRLDEIAPHHQGMIAYASAYSYAHVEDMLDLAQEKGEDPFLIVLDGVTDPHNLGAVIRSAECAGAHGVIVPERRSVGLTPAAVKASAGAIEHMKVARVSNLTRTLEELKKMGMWIFAVTMDGKDYRKIDFRGPVVLVIGSEGEGISRLVLEHSDVQVSLPMKGHIDSLNASVAAGIMMYRVLESRHP